MSRENSRTHYRISYSDKEMVVDTSDQAKDVRDSLRAMGIEPKIERITVSTITSYVSDRFLDNNPIDVYGASNGYEKMVSIEKEMNLKISICHRCCHEYPSSPHELSFTWNPVAEKDNEKKLITGYWVTCPRLPAISNTVHSYDCPPSVCPYACEHAVMSE